MALTESEIAENAHEVSALFAAGLDKPLPEGEETPHPLAALSPEEKAEFVARIESIRRARALAEGKDYW